jgi:pimeloyl-ACP methyl ester carboxylesterase
MKSLAHGEASVNGVTLHWAEQGEGPLVVLLHGFPEFWYSWHHQLPALAAAGFRAVAPDLRGYGLSGKPRGIRAYRIETLVADVAELVRGLGAGRGVFRRSSYGAKRTAISAPRSPRASRSGCRESVSHASRRRATGSRTTLPTRSTASSSGS